MRRRDEVDEVSEGTESSGEWEKTLIQVRRGGIFSIDLHPMSVSFVNRKY